MIQYSTDEALRSEQWNYTLSHTYGGVHWTRWFNGLIGLMAAVESEGRDRGGKSE